VKDATRQQQRLIKTHDMTGMKRSRDPEAGSAQQINRSQKLNQPVEPPPHANATAPNPFHN